MTLQDQFVDKLIGAAINVHRSAAGVANAALDQAHLLDNQLAASIHDAEIDGVNADYYRQRRAEGLIKDTTDTIDSGIADARAATEASLLNVAVMAQNEFAASFNDLFTVEVPIELLDDTELQDIVDSTLVQGATQDQWWEKLASDAKRNFSMGVRNGAAQRQAGQQLVNSAIGKRKVRATREVNDQIQTFYEHGGGMMDRTKNDIESIVTTLAASIAANVVAELTQRNQKFFDGKQHISVLDNRTSQLCRGRDHMAWDGEGEPIPSSGANFPFPGYPPYHMRCRSMIAPILKNYNQLKRIIPSLPASLSKELDGKASRKQTYQQWFDKQSNAKQLDILGPGKYAVYQTGKLSLADMLNFKGNPLTVKQIQAKAKRK
jgi:hypothetical protein